MEVNISDMDDKDFDDYPEDTTFVLEERKPIGIDPITGCLVYENTEPKPENMITV